MRAKAVCRKLQRNPNNTLYADCLHAMYCSCRFIGTLSKGARAGRELSLIYEYLYLFTVCESSTHYLTTNDFIKSVQNFKAGL